MKLCELIPGQRAEVVSVNVGGAPAARLRALGIAAGEEVALLRRAPFGGGLLLSCGGNHILLDAGISCRRITTALGILGLDAERLSAVKEIAP